MKQLPTDFLSFTEIGGVGEMIYTAVRFPAYVSEYEHCGDPAIKPLFSISIPPKAGTDYHLTGQDLLVSLCNLYQTINAPDSTVDIPEAIREWCTDHVLPYNSEVICSMVNEGKYAVMQFNEEIQREGTFYIEAFLKDLCSLGMAFELYYALNQAYSYKNPQYARSLYYEGRICDSYAFLEKYRNCESDEEYLQKLNVDREERMMQLVDLFPDFRMRLKLNPRTKKIEYGADVTSVFDICWYTFGRLAADIAPPMDTGFDDEFPQGSILHCLACGNLFLRRSSRQRYCQSADCQAERNRRNRRASYARHRNDGKDSATEE